MAQNKADGTSCVGGACQTGTCTSPSSGDQTCEEVLDCEIYEQCNAAENDCKIASWVYIAGGAAIGFSLLK